MKASKVIWFDVISPSEAFFFQAIVNGIQNITPIFTTVKHAENVPLLDLLGVKYKSIWKQPAQSQLTRYLHVAIRLLMMQLYIPRFDVSISFANPYAVLVSKSRLKPALDITDNDSPGSFHDKAVTLQFADYILIPNVIPIDNIMALGASKEKILVFNGYKEEVYLADFSPSREAIAEIPFDSYVVLRPEASFAHYVQCKSIITREIARELSQCNYKIVYLPRNSEEQRLVDGLDNIYIPQRPLDGRNLVWFSSCVLTGSGTLAREAALMGIPAVSFYPGKLISVDQKLVDEGKIFHSRNPEDIKSYVKKSVRVNQSLAQLRGKWIAAKTNCLRQVNYALLRMTNG